MSRSIFGRSFFALVALLCGLIALAIPVTANAKVSELAPKHIMQTLPAAASDQAVRGEAKPTRPGSTSNGINYHGGSLLTAGPAAYVIWYGNWSGNTTQNLVSAFFGGVGGSPYFNINTTYYNGSNVHVTNAVQLAGSATDSYSHGTALSDAGVQAVVSGAISSGKLPSDANGVYFVLTSADVSETSGFLTQYCGWHTHGTIGTTDIKYAFVGDASANLSACSGQSVSPNGNVAGDAMISVIAHELEEATTDPDLNAWYDTRGQENADKCAWTFGTSTTLPSGAKYNMTLGGTRFYIQRNWVNANGGSCSLSY